jgi:hypothetical protein
MKAVNKIVIDTTRAKADQVYALLKNRGYVYGFEISVAFALPNAGCTMSTVRHKFHIKTDRERVDINEALQALKKRGITFNPDSYENAVTTKWTLIE